MYTQGNEMSIIRIILPLVVSAVMALADTLPTVHQIYQTAQSGDLNHAHQMIEEVLRAHPESAKAHYVDAEILIRQNDFTNAKNEFAIAEKLAPGLPFAKPESVLHLRQRLASSSFSAAPASSNTMITTPMQNSNHIPWLSIVLGGGALILVWLTIRSFTSRNTSGSYPQNGANPYSGSGSNFGGSQPYPPQGGGLGGGIMSGLATGAAAGAGFVAGEELIHHFMDSSSNNNFTSTNTPFVDNNIQSTNNDMGGNDFGVDDSSSWDDSSTDSSDDNW